MQVPRASLTWLGFAIVLYSAFQGRAGCSAQDAIAALGPGGQQLPYTAVQEKITGVKKQYLNENLVCFSL